MSGKSVGARVLRSEDPRLLRGHGAFVDDILRRYDVPEMPDDPTRAARPDAMATAAPFSANSAGPQLEIAPGDH